MIKYKYIEQYKMLSKFIPVITNCMIGQRKKGVNYGGLSLYKNIIKNTNANAPKFVQSNTLLEYNNLYRTLVKTQHPLLLGGDHSIGQTSVMSAVYKDPHITVIWIDAHADIHTETSSVSKNRHGMPLSGCLGHDKLWFEALNNKKLLCKNLIYVGVRDLDRYEKMVLSHHKIKKMNPLQCIQYIRKYQDKKYHISFDVDSLDPKYLDATGTMAPNGLHPLDVKNIITECDDRLQSMDIVEFNPYLGDYKKSINTLRQIFC